MTRFLLPVMLGFIIDLILGDPYSWPHPVVLMGKAIEKGETFIRKRIVNEKLGGTILVLGVVFIFTAVPFLVLNTLEFINPTIRLVVESIMCWQCIAAKGLKTESMKVYTALKQEGLSEGRKAVSMIVGRDTENLTEEGVIKATVETIAENTSDGVIAPVFYMVFGGGTLGYMYKTINTVDSMIGYKNDKYMEFGRFGAKLDDVANFIPARLSALLMLVAGMFLELDFRTGFKMFKRDRFNHASPNSAQTESVCAGVLGIQLAGDARYFGEVYKKKTIGDELRPINIEDIVITNRLMYSTAFVMIFIIFVIWMLGRF